MRGRLGLVHRWQYAVSVLLGSGHRVRVCVCSVLIAWGCKLDRWMSADGRFEELDDHLLV